MLIKQKGMLTTIPSVHHCSPVYPQKEAESILDLMLLWFSLLDLVTKLASPFCRRLLCAAFCCLVSCLRTFWRTTSYRTHKNKDSRLLQMNAALSVSARQTQQYVDLFSLLHLSQSLTMWKLFSNTYRPFQLCLKVGTGIASMLEETSDLSKFLMMCVFFLLVVW